MVRLRIFIILISIICATTHGGAVLQEIKAKNADSVGGYIFSERINGKRSICVKINDTIRIRDSARVYANITDSVNIKGRLSIVDSLRKIRKIDTLAHISDSIRTYSKITDSVKIRGYIDVLDSIRKIRRIDTLALISDSVNIRGRVNFVDSVRRIRRIDTLVHIADTVIVKTRALDTPTVSVNIITNYQAPMDLFGYASNVTQNTDTVDLWTQGWTYRFPESKQQMACSSSSVQDAPAGTGIDTIYIEYLDSTYAEKSISCGLNGTTPVNTTVSDIFRVNSIHAKHFGSGSTTYKAIGNIFIRKKADLRSIYKVIPIGYTHSRGFNYTVPTGKTLYITSLSLSVGNSLPANNCASLFTLKATYDRNRNIVLAPGVFFLPHYEVYLTNQTFQRTFEIPLSFPQQTDIKISVNVNQSNSILSAYANGTIK